MGKAAGGYDFWMAFPQRTNLQIACWEHLGSEKPVPARERLQCCCCNTCPKVLGLAPISASRSQLHHLPMLEVFAAWRSCALLQPVLRSPKQASGKSLFIVGWGHPSRSFSSSSGTMSPNPRQRKEHPTPLPPSLKQLTTSSLQGGASQTSQPHKHPNTVLGEVLGSRHG